MTMLAEQIYAEVLRYLYVASSNRWPDALTKVVLAALAVVFLLAANRLRSASPRTPRPAVQRR